MIPRLGQIGRVVGNTDISALGRRFCLTEISRAVHIKTIQRPFGVDQSRAQALAALADGFGAAVCKICEAFEYNVSAPDVVREIMMSTA